MNETNNLMQAALEYAARGWRVFPLSANTKIPLAGTHGVKDATTDADTIRAWWTVNPSANIGLACGAASGVWVVDIDVGHAANVNGFTSVTESGKDCPATLTQTTPSGGAHRLYACTGTPPANKNGFLPGVDIRGDGYYIVVAPSVIDGKSYAWIDPSAPLAEFPDDMKPTVVSVNFPWAAQKPTPSAPRPWDAPARDAKIIERARAYISATEPAVQGLGGHNALLWAAQALVRGFRLDDGAAYTILADCFNPRCTPPWNLASPRDEKDFRRKITEARNHPINKADGWLLDERTELPDEDLGAAMIEAMLARAAEKNEAPQPAPVVDNDVLPESLLLPPGLVGQIAGYINDTAGCYQPILALGAALTFCGALFGRKVKDESGGRTNLYGMGVGHSSAGKDHAAKCLAKILQAANAEDLLAGEVTSDTAIEKALMAGPAKLFVIDEIGYFLKTLNQASGGSPHLKTIVPMFMKLFSSANSLYVGKQRVSADANKIDQPCVCIWGMTTPQLLFDNMTREELEGGWTARNLVFITTTRPKWRFTGDNAVPQAIATTVDAWWRRQIPAPDGEGNLKAFRAHQLVIPTDTDAWMVFDRFRDRAYENMLKADKGGDVTNYLWGKALENARRVALIVACGENFDGAAIGRTEAEYGCRLVEFLITRLADNIARKVSESRWQKDKMRMVEIIEKAGHKGLSMSEFVRKTQWVKGARERREMLEDLVAGSLVAIGRNPAAPQSRQNWLWTVANAPDLSAAETETENA